MRVVIDARCIYKGGKSTILLGILEKLDYSKNQYYLLGDRDVLEPLRFPCKIIHCKTKPHSLSGFLSLNVRNDINRFDCFFTPDYIIPMGIKINCYFLLEDMLFSDNRKQNKTPIKDFFKRIAVRRSYKKAKGIYTTSNFSRTQIIEYFGNKKPVYLLRPSVTDLQKRAGIQSSDIVGRKNYFVYVGNAKEHKNLKTLISALKKLNWKYQLHILTENKNLDRRGRKYFKKLSKNPNIKIKKNLNLTQYAEEIKEAKALVQPSFYEGYVSQILEALYYKTPCIVSRIPLHVEMFNNNEVTFFQPNDVNDLVSTLDSDIKLGENIEEKLQTFSNQKVANTIANRFIPSEFVPHIRRNFIFNVIYQILVVLIPLITAPYVSRILGASNIGMFSFAYTIAYYFIIFGYLGFQQYAQRAIAEADEDREEQSRIFWRIIIIRLIPVVIGLFVLYALYFANVFGEYSKLVLILSIVVAATAVDINFYFHGKENFFVVMIINLIIRLAFLFCIFNFVHDTSDLGVYTLLYALMIVGSYISMWVMLPTTLKRVRLGKLDFSKHMKASLSLFLPVAAVSVYAILDKTLIGLLMTGETYQTIQLQGGGFITFVVNKSDVENGLYYQAERIVKALLSIILAFGAVMTTRNSMEYTKRKYGTIKKNIYKSFRFVFAVGVPIMIGIVVVSQSFVPVFFGYGYDKVANLIMAYSPIILFMGISNIIGMQYLLPTKQDYKYSISILIGFAINLILNIIFIPSLGAMGAIIGTLISEFMIMLIQYLFVRDIFSLKIIFKIIWKYIVAGLVMGAILYPFYFYILDTLNVRNIVNLIILIPSGVALYYFMLIILEDKVIFKHSKILIVSIYNGVKYKTILPIMDSVSRLITIQTVNSHSAVAAIKAPYKINRSRRKYAKRKRKNHR